MKSKNGNKGFSLLETLLYLAIFAIIGGSLFGILTNVVRISTREVSGDEVASQLQFAMETVTRLVQSSSNIEIATTTATTTLKLRMADPLLDPTCISLVNGTLKLSQGPDAFQPQNCKSESTNITTSKVIVDNALFKRVEFPGGHDQVAVDLQFSNTATGASKISRALRSGIARVSAATFDSDLLPNADNSYEVGFSGTKRWKNISISNVLNLGVISADPAGIDGSVYYNSTSKAFRGKANGTWGDLGSSLWLATSTNNMYSNVTGNVGIGTKNPLSNLHVVATSNGYDGTVRVGGSVNSLGLLLEYDQDAATVGTIYSNPTYTNPSALLKIGVDGDANPNQLVLTGGGNVGIGTASPQQELHIKGQNAGIRFESLEAGTSNFEINNAGWGSTYGLAVQDRTAVGDPVRLYVKTDGNVGIGTTNPQSKLHVNGDMMLGFNGYGTAIAPSISGATIGRQMTLFSGSTNSPALSLEYYSTGYGLDMWVGTTGLAPVYFDQRNNDAIIFRTKTASTPVEAMRITGAGNMGIGTATPGYKLEVAGNAANTTGVWAVSSDERLKRGIFPIQSALQTVTALQGVGFNWRDDEKNGEYGRVMGFVAQDVEKVLPQWVKTGDDGYKRLETIGMDALIVEAIKEQQRQIEVLKTDVAELKK